MTDYLLNTKSISTDEREIIEYGIESIISNLLGTTIVIAVGAWFDCLIEAIMVWGFLLPLRKNAGGYHAKTKTRCLIMSIMIFVLSFQFILKANWTLFVYTIIAVTCSAIIVLIAPIGNQNKCLDKKELLVYGKRTRKILLCEGIVYLSALFLKAEFLCKILVVDFVIVAFSLVLGKFKLEMDKRVFY